MYRQKTHSVSSNDYNEILTILSLISAGAISGFWALNYQDALNDETCFLNIISDFFVLIFYVLFTAIAYYMGMDQKIKSIHLASWILPVLMFLLLEINSVIDIWDFRDGKKKKVVDILNIKVDTKNYKKRKKKKKK